MEGDEALIEFDRLVIRVDELAGQLAKRFGATETSEYQQLLEALEKLRVCTEQIKRAFSDRPQCPQSIG